MVKSTDVSSQNYVQNAQTLYSNTSVADKQQAPTRSTDPNDLRAKTSGTVKLDKGLSADTAPQSKASSHQLKEITTSPDKAVIEGEHSIQTISSERSNFKESGGAAAASGNATATYTDTHGDQWIGKKSTLTKTVTEAVAQRLGTELLGSDRAPITILANDGTLFSKKPEGESSNLEQFFADPDNLQGLSAQAKTQIQDSLLDAIVFKVVTGDSDIIPENFVLDQAKNIVFPIDGENAFIGLVSGNSGELENWSEKDFNDFISNPDEYIQEIFSEAGIDDVGFLSEGIDQNALLGKFVSLTNQLYDNDYAVVQTVVDQTVSDLTALDENTGRLSQDNSLLVELNNHLEDIKSKITSSVEQLYGFAENRFYSE